jgi:hypothetical protein
MRELILARPRSRRLRLKMVLRYSRGERLFRVFRIMWDGDWPTIPARKFSLAIRLWPTPFPLRLRFDRSYGGNWG